MRTKLGYLKRPKGGFGNRVMSYLSLRQLSHQTGLAYFSHNTADKPFIRGIHRPLILSRYRRQRVIVSKGDVPAGALIEFVHEISTTGQDIIFRVPLLGEAYAEIAAVDSRILASATVDQCTSHLSELDNRPLITLHLRGGDFSRWNPDAILGPSYYHQALDSLEKQSDESVFRICTDDPAHPALESVSARLSSGNRLVASSVCRNSFECDFAAMLNSEYLISSPSTFAIVAGLLGKAKVLHSKEWVESRCSRGEVFWEKVLSNSLPGYSVQSVV